jgi:hypothetical protein
LALVPLTIILGISASAISGVTTQIQDYVVTYSMTRVATDAADILIKTPGEPPNWNSTNPPTTVGLAEYDESTNITEPNKLDDKKVMALNDTTYYGTELYKEHLPRLIGNVTYYNLTIEGLENATYIKSWYYGSKSNASNIIVIKRTALLEIEKIEGSIFQVSHFGSEVTEPCNDPRGGEPRIYETDFYVAAGDLEIYDYWLVVYREDAGGQPMQYGIFDEKQDCDDVDTPNNLPNQQVVKEQIDDYLYSGSQNYLYLRVAGNPNLYADAYIIRVPAGTPPDAVSPENAGPKAVSVTLEVGR